MGINDFLAEVRGVVHVGANIGHERNLYQRNKVQVLWVEPLPHIFTDLEQNISGFDGQIAVQALVTDVDDQTYPFHISSNDALSSSILELKLHAEVYPDVHMTRTLQLVSTSLPTLFARNGIDPAPYDSLVLDTQGSELLVLTGCLAMLDQFRYVKTEVANYEAYEGCCQLPEIEAFMHAHGYIEVDRQAFGIRSETESYFDIVYKRRAA